MPLSQAASVQTSVDLKRESSNTAADRAEFVFALVTKKNSREEGISSTMRHSDVEESFQSSLARYRPPQMIVSPERDTQQASSRYDSRWRWKC